MKRIQAAMELPAKLQRERDKQQCSKNEEVNDLGSGILVKMDHIDDVTFVTRQLRGLLLRCGWFADRAGCLGLHVT